MSSRDHKIERKHLKPGTAKKKEEVAGERAVYFNYVLFKSRNRNKALALSVVFTLLFFICLFKNISYPLFWADESATAVGSERVLHFGYPKVHDGKNVFYDLRHSNAKLGIDSSTDAYIGGSGWGQFYFGTIGYKLSERTNDIYKKTGIYRATFAIAGVIGILFILLFVAKLFEDSFSRYAFVSLFFLMELCSVSLILVLKQVRYYSISLLLISAIMSIYGWYRFYKPFNRVVLSTSLVIALWLLFNTFSPVYFLTLLTLLISELVIGVVEYAHLNLRSSVNRIFPVIVALLISLISILPLLFYYRTFEIAKAMADFNGYGTDMYWDNVKTIFNYFNSFDFLWLAIILKLLVFLHFKKLLTRKRAWLKLSNFLTLFFLVYCFAIARVPNFIFTRYFMPVQPLFTIFVILDLFLLLDIFSLKSLQLISLRMYFILLLTSLLLVVNVIRNSDNLQGRVYEMTHRYKGPLDYTIPYIKSHYPKTSNLIIATNYEETSFMYYLKSKVLVGYVGNNLAEDSVMQPDILMYRKSWGNFANIFNKYVQQASYQALRFPVKDLPCNDIPELNFFNPEFNHQFYTQLPENAKDSTDLYLKTTKN
jgi:hypothetical protein